MKRYCGTETEYGIATPSQPDLSPIVTSTQAVVSYATRHSGARSRWDFAAEHPTRDTRGFELRRYYTPPMVDPDAVGVANVITSNGARFYVDHAHPEYSSPECSDAFQAMLYDQAGDRIALTAIEDVAYFSERNQSALTKHKPCPPLKIYKNNVDGKGASYGAHENYLYSRETDFDDIVAGLTPFFVTRIIFVGAGRVGRGQEGQEAGFQISQRADYIEQEISLETTLNRGIINTRDEPHADAQRFGRLHVIVGDANMSQTATFLKLGATSLVLDAIEAGADFSDLKLAEPVEEFRRVSYDLSCRHQLQLASGRKATAIDIQRAYITRIRATVAELSEVEQKVLDTWTEVLDLLATGPLSAAHLLDWVAKYQLISKYTDRGLSIDDPKIALIDLQYTDIDPQRSLYHALVRSGRMRTLVSEEDIARAAQVPPEDSRAWTRGRMVDTFADEVLSANWQELSFRNKRAESDDSACPTVDLALVDLDRLTKAETEEIIADSTSATEAIETMRERGLLTASHDVA